MIIKKLELQGFKSFPEKTKILFHPGITAVTGPNGTGKSNIVDALLWVMGGKRFKTLRGERSTDIIFNGHESKPPLSMADVNLYLGDDGEEEIIISHRFFRSGESEYRLNGKAVRLMDIQDCLWKKAVGELRYFVIEQGSIGIFLNSKPQEKRVLLEEAAGTAYYKDKKAQAESKLQSSEQNLIRLEDIISEVSRAKNSLKRQASAAARYRKLRDKIRAFTSLYYRKKIEDLEKSQKESTSNLEKFLSQENALLSRIKDEERVLASKRKECWDLENNIKEAQENLYSLKSSHSRLETERDQSEKRVSFFEERKQKVQENIQELSKEHALLEEESRKASESLKKFEKTLQQKRKDLDKASHTIQFFQEKRTLQQKSIESLRSQYFLKLDGLTEARNEKARFEKEWEIFLRQEEKLNSQLEKEKTLLDEKEEEIRGRLEEIEKTQSQRQDIKKHLEQSQKELETLLSSIETLKKKISDLKEKKEKDNHHLQLLQKIEKEERGSEAEKDIPESMGFLADFIESDSEYAPLIDILWKEEAKSRLIRAEDFMKNWSQERSKGNFLLLHPEKKGETELEPLKDARMLGRLKSHVRASPKIKDFFTSLQEAAVVKDIRRAVELWLRHPTQNYITLQGDLLLSSGLLKLGAKKAGFFSLVQEIKKLKETISETDKKITPLELETKEMEKQQRGLEKNIEQKKENIGHLEKQIEEKERERTFDQAEKERIKLNISTLTNELKIFGEDKGQMQKKLQSITEKLKASKEEEFAFKNALQSWEKEFEALQRKNEEKRRSFFELKSEIELLQEKIKNVHHQLQTLDRRKESLDERSLSLQKEIQNAEEIKSQLKEDIRSLSQKIEKFEEEIDLKEKQLVQNEVLLKKIQKEQEELEQRIEKLREDQEAIKKERIQWEIRKAEKDRDLANLEESCWQELKKSLEEVKKEVGLDKLKETGVQEKLEEAREKLQKFKAVNLMAEEEYLSQKKRYDFLMKEKKDLRESIDTTKQAIKKIDQESKDQFSKALAEINKNFQEMFALLFKGGKAELKLTDESNPLESGVEMTAQPPGKKLQSLSLLSGGERSLTSLAFFFALFRYKPTPFCILDEVDAALDEVNLERFLNLMRKIKSQTQFILITHNFKTMEVADYIYGTTMAEPNITTLYSIKLDKKKPS